MFGWEFPIPVLIALGVDGLVGDPRFLVHPVVWIGRFITWFERCAVKFGVGSARRQRALGVALVFCTIGVTVVVVWTVLLLAAIVSPWLALVMNVWLMSTTIAWKGLVDAGRAVERALRDHGLEAARAAVGMIVGRDTESLAEPDVVRAAVETLAENIVDAIVSPVLYGMIGGATLAMAYKAVNTLDSMVGYRNERYLYLGWASARLDDVANYLPARLTALLLFLAFVPLHTALRAWRVMRRDAHKHPSPNSGIPESMVAGGLGVVLGGRNTYGGVASERARMGDALRPLAVDDIRQTIGVIHRTVGLLILLLLSVTVILAWLHYGGSTR